MLLNLSDLSTAEKSRAAIAATKQEHPAKDGIVFVTSATAAKMGLTKDTNWNRRIKGRVVTNAAFSLAAETIDGNQVLICEDERLGIHYSTAEAMAQLYA